MNPTRPDPVIDEIREIRHCISASYDHDPAKLVAYLMQYQEQFQDRLIYDPIEQALPNKALNTDAQKARAG